MIHTTLYGREAGDLDIKATRSVVGVKVEISDRRGIGRPSVTLELEPDYAEDLMTEIGAALAGISKAKA